MMPIEMTARDYWQRIRNANVDPDGGDVVCCDCFTLVAWQRDALHCDGCHGKMCNRCVKPTLLARFHLCRGCKGGD